MRQDPLDLESTGSMKLLGQTLRRASQVGIELGLASAKRRYAKDLRRRTYRDPVQFARLLANNLNYTPTSRPDVRLLWPAFLDKDERMIVGGHRHDLAQLEPVARSFANQFVYVAHAPPRVPPLEVRVEGGIGGRRMHPA